MSAPKIYIYFYILVKEKCPDEHPYAYFNGSYCCKEGDEDINENLGELCDGGKISLSSVCCKNNVTCPVGRKCKNSDSLTIAGILCVRINYC